MCGNAGRKMSNASGFSQRVSSWLAEPMWGVMLSPGPMVTPASSTSQVVVRLMVKRGGSQRRPSSIAWGNRERSALHRFELIGVGQEEVEQVARRTVGRLRPRRQQQAEEGVDGLVAQLLAVDLRGDEVADDVLGRLGPPIRDHAGEVVAQGLRRGQAPVDVGNQPDELDGPALELREVLLGEPEQPGDDPHGELECQLAHQIGVAVGREAIDQLVDDRPDEFGFPACQGLLAERVRHEIAVRAVFGVVHAEDHVAHHHADAGVVGGGREGLGVAQNA